MNFSLKGLFKKALLFGLPSALCVSLGAAYWLFNTASGAGWLWNQLGNVLPGVVQTARIEGDLASGFIIGGLDYQSDDITLRVNRLELQAGLGWWPLSIQIPVIALRDVDVVVQSSEQAAPEPNPQADLGSMLATLKLPVPLNIQEALITNVTFQTGDGPPINLLETLSFQVVLHERLLVEQLHLQATDFAAAMQGYLSLEAPFALQAKLTGRYEMSEARGAMDLDLPFVLDASGDLDKLLFTLASQQNGLEIKGELQQPGSVPVWDVTAELKSLQWPINNSDELLMLSDLSVASQGQIDQWVFAIGTGIESGALQRSSLTVSGSGSVTGMQIDSALLTGPGVDFDLSGNLDWSSQPQAAFKAGIKKFDLSPWLEGLSADEYLGGELELNWSSSRLQIPRAKLTVAGTDLALDIEADVNVETDVVDGRIDWSSLQWPLANETPDYLSRSGSLRISGSLDEWQTGGRFDVQLGDYPEGSFEVKGGGNRTAAHLNILDGAVLGGHISGEVSADWQDGTDWAASIHASGVDPSPLLPEWPGRLDADVEVSAQSQAERYQVNLLSLQGIVRGVQISGRGGLNIEGEAVAFENFEVRTDEAELLINGATAEPAGASVKFSGYLPSMLLQGARGGLELEGTYSSYTGSPVFALNLEAVDLAWNGAEIKSLAVTTGERAAAGLLPAIEIGASGLSYDDIEFDQMSLALGPAGDRYSLTVNLLNETIILGSAITLVPERSDDLFGSPWHGVLDELQLAVAQLYEFELQAPASFAWSTSSSTVGPLCLQETNGAGLCLEAELTGSDDWSLSAEVSAIPLDYLRDLLELDVHFEQMLEGHMEFSQASGQAPTGGAAFRITAGRILDTDENELLAESAEGEFGFVLQNGNLESGVLDIKFPGTGFIDFQFEILNIIEDGARKLKGRALTQLDDIKLFGGLAFPGMDEISGAFESNILLGGSLQDPTFEGGFKLSNGLVQYVPIGMKLEDIEIEGKLEKRDQGSLKGSFRAGEGIGSVTGNLLFKHMEELQMDVAVSGDQLLLIHTDALEFLTEADLKLELSPQHVDINGYIRVPSARLTPANLLLETVNDSEDLVVETGANDSDAEAETPKNKVFGQLEVAFGDDVFIKVPGIETHLSGSVVYRWNGDYIPLAEGSYDLRGKVDIYGPTLQISNGRISFPKVPANNPLLNIKAGRDIYGNTQIRSAGVQLIGTLKRPVLEAYTVPVTNEERAWTLLVTGTDFDQAQGVGGFDVGTYIAPKLYVSYGVSLFQEDSVISARYDLKKGFGVKVTSGQRESGLDVSYTIDR